MVPHGPVAGGGLPVHPDPAGRQHFGEALAVAGTRHRQHGVHGIARDLVAPGSRCLSGRSEQPKHSHGRSVPAPLPSPVVQILMVRHGESEWNALGRWQGHADPPLSALGIEQVRAAARALGSFDAVAASDLQRARHTAELLAEALGVGPVIIDPRLRETHAAEWEGLTHAEIEQLWPGYLEAGRRPPGFESYHDTATRASLALFDLRRHLGSGTVLVVSHSGTIRSLRHRWGDPAPRLPNLAGTWFDVHDGAITVGTEVHLLRQETLADTD